MMLLNKTLGNNKRNAIWICLTAMFMALNIVLSSFGVPVPGGRFYLNDIVICTAAIILDPQAAFIVGGVGAFIGDFLFYPAPMFVSLITHGLQAVVISCFVHKFFRNSPIFASGIGVILGAIIMVAGYTFGRAFIYGTPEYAILKIPYQILQATIGAVMSMFLCWKCNIYEYCQLILKK